MSKTMTDAEIMRQSRDVLDAEAALEHLKQALQSLVAVEHHRLREERAYIEDRYHWLRNTIGLVNDSK